MKFFGIVSKSIMSDASLSAEARALYALLACYCNRERTCFPATATLARLMGRSTPTIYRLLAELEKARVVGKARQGRRRILLLRDGEKGNLCEVSF